MLLSLSATRTHAHVCVYVCVCVCVSAALWSLRSCAGFPNLTREEIERMEWRCPLCCQKAGQTYPHGHVPPVLYQEGFVTQRWLEEQKQEEVRPRAHGERHNCAVVTPLLTFSCAVITAAAAAAAAAALIQDSSCCNDGDESDEDEEEEEEDSSQRSRSGEEVEGAESDDEGSEGGVESVMSEAAAAAAEAAEEEEEEKKEAEKARAGMDREAKDTHAGQDRLLDALAKSPATFWARVQSLLVSNERLPSSTGRRIWEQLDIDSHIHYEQVAANLDTLALHLPSLGVCDSLVRQMSKCEAALMPASFASLQPLYKTLVAHANLTHIKKLLRKATGFKNAHLVRMLVEHIQKVSRHARWTARGELAGETLCSACSLRPRVAFDSLVCVCVCVCVCPSAVAPSFLLRVPLCC